MKKLVTLLLAVVMTFTCVACGNSGNAGGNGAGADAKDATGILSAAWVEYNKSASEDVKFPAGGGNAETMVMDEPAKFDPTIEYAEDALLSMYCIPSETVAKTDDIATLLHMMNGNNFTAAAYHVTNAADVEGVIGSIKETTLNNQWMCGMPEKLVIFTVDGDYVVSVYGLEALVDTFETSLTSVYGDKVVVSVEENIAQ